MLVFAAFGLYRHPKRQTDRGLLVRVPPAMTVVTLAVVAQLAVFEPAYVATPEGLERIGLPSGVVGVFFLLGLALTSGVRFAARPRR